MSTMLKEGVGVIMYMDREKLLKDIMAIDFTLVDLNLYLDTHPCDCRTIMLYNNCVTQSRILRSAYERMYGPLCPSTHSKCPWQWIESPWPWELED